MTQQSSLAIQEIPVQGPVWDSTVGRFATCTLQPVGRTPGILEGHNFGCLPTYGPKSSQHLWRGLTDLYFLWSELPPQVPLVLRSLTSSPAVCVWNFVVFS